MSPAEWLPIRYRDFWDIPRIFVVAMGKSVFLFDSPFDSELDDYSADYRLYQLPRGFVVPESGSWEDLPRQGILIGTVATHDVVFDRTRRAAIDGAILRSFVR